MRGMCLLKDDVKEENIIATAHNRIIRSLVGVAFSSLLIAFLWMALHCRSLQHVLWFVPPQQITIQCSRRSGRDLQKWQPRIIRVCTVLSKRFSVPAVFPMHRTKTTNWQVSKGMHHKMALHYENFAMQCNCIRCKRARIIVFIWILLK